MNSLVILRDGRSLKIEFIRAIRAALRRASAFVGHAFKKKEIIIRGVTIPLVSGSGITNRLQI